MYDLSKIISDFYFLDISPWKMIKFFWIVDTQLSKYGKNSTAERDTHYEFLILIH